MNRQEAIWGILRPGNSERMGDLWYPKLNREGREIADGSKQSRCQSPHEVPGWWSEEIPGSFTSHTYTDKMTLYARQRRQGQAHEENGPEYAK